MINHIFFNHRDKPCENRNSNPRKNLNCFVRFASVEGECICNRIVGCDAKTGVSIVDISDYEQYYLYDSQTEGKNSHAIHADKLLNPEIFNTRLVQSIREATANIEKISSFEWEDMENQDPEDVF